MTATETKLRDYVKRLTLDLQLDRQRLRELEAQALAAAGLTPSFRSAAPRR